MIYFVQVDGKPKSPVKVGHTHRKMSERLGGLQTGSAEWLVCLATMPGGSPEEADLHERFRLDWIRGEWFRWSEALAEVIAKAREVENTALRERSASVVRRPPTTPIEPRRPEPTFTHGDGTICHASGRSEHGDLTCLHGDESICGSQGPSFQITPEAVAGFERAALRILRRRNPGLRWSAGRDLS